MFRRNTPPRPPATSTTQTTVFMARESSLEGAPASELSNRSAGAQPLLGGGDSRGSAVQAPQAQAPPQPQPQAQAQRAESPFRAPPAAAAAPQSTPPAGGFNPPDAEPCFRAEQVARYHGETPRSLIIRTSIGRYYRIGFAAPCPNVMRKDMSLTVASSTSGEVCRPIDLTVVATASQFPMHCAVSSIQPLTGAEVRALPPRIRP